MNKTTIATFIILITLAVVSLLPRTAFAQNAPFPTEGSFTSDCSGLCRSFFLYQRWRLGGKQAVQEYIDTIREDLEELRTRQEDEYEEYVTDYVDNWEYDQDPKQKLPL